MAALFYWMLNITAAGSVAGGIIMLLRLIKPIPRGAVCALWAIPALRFLIPFGVNFRYSLSRLIKNFSLRMHTVDIPSLNGVSIANYWGLPKKYHPMIFATDAAEKTLTVAAFVWMVIAGACILTALFMYFSTVHELRDAKPVGNGIYLSGKVLSPTVAGIFRPKIIMPLYLENGEEYAILHEKMHIRRGDNLFRLIAALICCLHWFNPFVWIFAGAFLRDAERACDEAVLKRCGEDKKEEYAAALIACEEKKCVFLSAFGGEKTRVRIKNILSYKKMTFVSSAATVLLAAILVLTLLTN